MNMNEVAEQIDAFFLHKEERYRENALKRRQIVLEEQIMLRRRVNGIND